MRNSGKSHQGLLDTSESRWGRVEKHESDKAKENARNARTHDPSLYYLPFPVGRNAPERVGKVLREVPKLLLLRECHVRRKEPSFFVVAQRALSIETSFRVIGIQIFYPRHPASLLREGCCLRRVTRKERAGVRAREAEG